MRFLHLCVRTLAVCCDVADRGESAGSRRPTEPFRCRVNVTIKPLPMHPDAPRLLQRRLDRLHEDHLASLLDADRLAMTHLDLRRKASISLAFGCSKSGVTEALSIYLKQMRESTVVAAQNSGERFSREDMATLRDVATQRLTSPDLYLARYESLCEGIVRTFERAGQMLDVEPFRPDLHRALIQVGTSSLLSKFVRDLDNDLEELVQRNESRQAVAPAAAPTEQAGGVDKFNRAVKLVPTFMGMSIDVNYLLKRWFGRKS